MIAASSCVSRCGGIQRTKKIQFKTENYTTFSVVDDETSRCISVSVCQNFGQSETRLILERDQAKSKALKIELQIKKKSFKILTGTYSSGSP